MSYLEGFDFQGALETICLSSREKPSEKCFWGGRVNLLNANMKIMEKAG